MDSNPPPDPDRVESLFAEALERPPAERTTFVEHACAGDAGLRAEVASLLAAHDETCDVLDARFPTDARQAVIRATVEAPGLRIGRYKLLQEIGHGGFGTVWMAEQEEPVKRRVALKVIKLGMDTRQVVARFEAERQALAMMDHPCIAKVLDGGATQSGRPYFVMELVKGVPITEYCDTHNLSTTERLELFTEVCHAVQHAHQKGIIHRDLKPSNVLVTLHDGAPVPKVIDFGIAKATSHRLTDKTLFTEFRQFIGTPEYMAPEQAEMSGLDIDTRADIYSLGVLLYELLTGTKPFDLHELAESGYDEIVRHIREIDPPKPSTRTSTLGDKITAIALRRRIAPAQLTKVLRKDLDWIVMKALEKDRSRRYATASAFADDVGCFLADKPIAARPPNAVYRMRKYVRRHRLGVAAGSLVAAAFLVGLVLAAAGYWEASRQRDAARVSEAAAIREKTTAEAARQDEKKERERAGTVVDLLRTMMSSANPREVKGRDYTVRQLLDDFSARLGDRLKNEPEVEATIDGTIGNAFRELGLLDKAATHLSHALETNRRRFGDASEEYLAASRDWALVVRDRGDYREAERSLRAALDARHRASPPDSECLASSLDARADLLRLLGRYDEAERLARDAQSMQSRLFGDDSDAASESLTTLARLRQDRGDFPGAETLYREVLALRTKRHGGDSLDVGEALLDVAYVTLRRGDAPTSEALVRRAHSLFGDSLGDEHRLIATALNALALARQAQDDLVGAEQLQRQAIAMMKKLCGEEHPGAATMVSNLAIIVADRGNLGEAEALGREQLSMKQKSFGDEHPEVATAMNDLVLVLEKSGKFSEAESLARRTLDMRKRLLGDEHLDAVTSLENLSRLVANQGDFRSAHRMANDTLTLRKKLQGDRHPSVANVLNLIALIEWSRRDFTAAESLAREALDIGRSVFGDAHTMVAESLNAIALAQSDSRRFEEASATFRKALCVYREIHVAESPLVARALGNIATNYIEQRDLRRAEPLIRRSLALFRKLHGDEHYDVAMCLNNLGTLLRDRGDFVGAASCHREALEIRRKTLRTGHHQVTASIRGLSLSLLDGGAFVEAEPLLREHLTLERGNSDADSQRIVDATTMLATCLSEVAIAENAPQKAVEAEALLRDLIANPPANPSSSPVRLSDARWTLGVASAAIAQLDSTLDTSARLERLAEAEPLIVGEHNSVKRTSAMFAPIREARMRQTLPRLIRLYETWDRLAPDSGKGANASEWRSKLADLDAKRATTGDDPDGK